MKRLLSLLVMILFITSTWAQNITGAEYFIDTDPGPGNGTATSVGTVGSFVNFTANIPTLSLSNGFHFVGIRAKDANNMWGLFETRGFYISSTTSDAANIIAAEYFFDSDPGIGNGTAISVGTTGAVVNFSAVIPTSLPAGFHFVAIRTKDANGIWGLFETRGFYISSNTTNAANIVAAEYFFDSDPGVGNATVTSVGTTGGVVNFSASIPTSLPAGFHFLAIRTKGQDGIWGLFETRGFYISNATSDAANIVAAEFFFDTDPGVGNATATSVGATGSFVNFSATIPTSLSAGFHFLAIRTKGQDGIWGLFETRGFYISSATANAANIVAAEYYFDTDPGPGNGTAVSVGTTGGVVNFTANIPTSLPVGFHFLSIRTKGQDGVWGLYENRGFYISNTTSDMSIITAAEYFYDADPGIGNGTPLTINTPGNIVTQTFIIPAGSLSLGQHFLSIRVKDQSGYWGLYEYDTLNIGNSTISCPANITVSTGIGQCTAIVNGIDPNINIPQAYTFTLSGATTGSGSGTASGQIFNPGVTTVFYALSGSPTVNCSFTVTVNTVAPAITIQPVTQSVCIGTNVTFSVTATGSNLSYQWRKGGVNIPTATSSSYTITGVISADAGNYDVIVSTTCATSVTSSTAVLTVGVTNITSQPVNQTVCPGNNVSFTVSATGAGLTYQWRKASVNIAGATSATYTIVNAIAANAGNYDVVVTGTCGVVTSNSVSLTVNASTLITLQPTSQTVCAGTNVTFNVTGTGTGVITYQWKKNGINIGGATLSSLTLNTVSIADAANYTVDVTGTCGTVTSNTAILTVNASTAITTQPVNLSSCLGGSVTFNITATGTSLAYQWKKNGVDIVGATLSNYTINPVTATDAATYTVLVTGTCGTQTSSGGTLSITAGTTINIQPADQSSCLGNSVTFNVSASGSGAITYQWKKNGIDISGAISSNYTINSVAATDAGNYSVVVTSNCGSVTSNTAVLSIIPATIITTQPVSQTVCSGSNASFTVIASGNNLTYQWRKAGINIVGATSSILNLTAVTIADIANYDVVVSGTCTPNVISNLVSLTVNTAAAITTQPGSQTICAGANATFTITATGSALTYQWRKGGVNITGANSASFTITGATLADAGSYDIVVNGICPPSVTSNTVTLTVNPNTVINTQPVSQTVCTGSNVSFSVIASGSSLTYQWRKGGINITGATSSTYTITSALISDAANYDVIVSGTCGNITSNIASLVVNSGAAISTQPVSQTVCAGNNVSFSVTATGTSLSYQWRKGGVNIVGATNAILTLNAVTLADASNYDVVITASCGTVTSNTVVLTVNNVTAISVQPISQSVCTGSNVNFSVNASGTSLTYQWRKGGVNIAGAISATYSLTSVTVSDAANYDVIVTGACGTVTSSIAILTINTNTGITLQPISQVVCTGSNVIFSVNATGTSLTYQWRKGAVNITGATSSTYTITGVTVTDAGNYDVIVTGSCGTINSAIATLTLNANTSISIQPNAQTVCESSNISFSVTAVGTGLTYQWRKGGINIAGATSSIFTIASVLITDAGNYDVVVNGICGNVTSSAAALSVNSTGTWTGITNSDWNTASNWCGGFPTSTTDVIIPSSAANMPNINGGSGNARNITINTGGSLTISSSGALNLYGSVTNNGAFNVSAGNIIFAGTNNHSMPAFTANNVTLNGTGDVNLTANATINNTLTLTIGNLVIGNHDLTLGNSSNGSSTSHIITNGTGNVIAKSLAASTSRTIPVGPDATSYNPAVISANAGHITDDLTVRVIQGVFKNGISGALFTDKAVGKTWIINETVTGGSNLNITLQWSSSNELTGFDRNKCYVTQIGSGSWLSGTASAANGTDPYTQTKTNITDLSYFSVQTQPINIPRTGIYPNPVSTILNIVFELETPESVTFSIYDEVGQLVRQKSASLISGVNFSSIDVRDLSGGVYILKISTSKNQLYTVTKFVKK